MSIEHYILEKRELINRELDRILTAEHELNEFARYTILAPGHRWRPIITIATAEMYGVPDDEILPIACCIEILHGTSMIIDDLPSFDNAMTRRGRTTLHRVSGEALAIWTSWYTLNFALSLLSYKNELPQQTREKFVDDFGNLVSEMISGQTKDILSKGKTMTPEQILRMYEQKSGALYGFSAVAGGIVGRASDSKIEALRKYGRSMGTAYQILDDILDIEAKPEEIGKDVGQDVGKPTLPLLVGIETSREKAKKLMVEAKEALAHIPRDTSVLRDLVDYIALVNKQLTTPIIRFDV